MCLQYSINIVRVCCAHVSIHYESQEKEQIMQTKRLKEGVESINTFILKILCTQCRFAAVKREGEDTDGAQCSLDRP